MNWLRDLVSQLSSAFRFWVILAPWEQGLRIRGGKKAKLLLPGVRLVIPFWDRVYRQSIRRRTCSTPTQVVTTTDNKAYSSSLVIIYSVTDLQTLYDTLHYPDRVLEAEAAGLLAEYISSRPSAQISSKGLQDFISNNMDLSRYGLQCHEIRTASFAAVRTYRLITGDGDFASWGGVETERYVGQRGDY